MPNTTDIFWEVDGVSLNTLAWNISTLADRMTPPPLRGTNLTIPHRRGQLYMPKTVDARNLPLGMWVIGKTAEELQKNWRMLQRLLWRQGRQFTLTKRMKIDGVIRVVETQAEFVSGMEPTMMGPKGAKFTVTLKLADPYYYDRDYTYVTMRQGINRLDVPGDIETTKIIVRALPGTSGLLDFNMLNRTNGISIAYEQENVPLSASESLVIDVDAFEAELDGRDVEQYIAHYGSQYWFQLEVGTNMINYGTVINSLSKEVQIMYKAAWL